MLNIKSGVVVRKIVHTQDGYGGTTTATTLTTIKRASIWQPGGGDSVISDKITKASTHVLAVEYGEYTFTDDDREVTYGGNTYEITGHADDVASRGELVIVGLKWLS
jgi:hypothetical protein